MALVTRGLVASRTKAKRLIQSGHVLVNAHPNTSASTLVTARDAIELTTSDLDVGRGAVKLRAALDAFTIPVAGAIAADIGASTGGFTQVLLERGVHTVVAIDIGHGQLDASLRGDPRVITMEGVHAAHLSANWWEANDLPSPVTIVVVDVSFISLLHVIPALLETFGVHSHYVFLVKPQFEVGRGGAPRGVVKDGRLREKAVETVLAALRENGLVIHGVIDSPIAGESGNLEYLVHAGGDSEHFSDRIEGARDVPEDVPNGEEGHRP